MVVKPRTKPLKSKNKNQDIKEVKKDLPKYNVVYKEEPKVQVEEVIEEKEEILFDLLEDLDLDEE